MDEDRQELDAVDFVKNDQDGIPIRDMIARVSITIPLSIYGPTLELRDEDEEKEEILRRENYPNP